MNLSRRKLVKGIGATAVTVLSAGGLETETAENRFQELQDKIERRKSIREENPGGTIYLGSTDSYDHSIYGGTVYDSNDFNDVQRMLGEGKKPQEVVDSGNPELETSGKESGQPVTENSEEVKLVYFSEDGNRPLDDYSQSLQKAFHKLDPSLDLDVSIEEVNPNQEDLESLENISSGQFKGMEADLDLKTKYSNTGQEPVFLLEDNLLPRKSGVSDYFTGVAFVELKNNEASNRHTINHELGHSILGLPHNFHENGIMSYNPEADRDESFHPRSQMIANALLTGDREFDVKDGLVQEVIDGEIQEKKYRQIDVEHTSRDLGSKAVTQEFFDHLDTYFEEVLGYSMDSFTPETHELFEKNDRVYDIATYSHSDGSKMRLKIDHYIEDMSLDPSG